MAKDKVIKFTKEQFLRSEKYGDCYVLNELLENGESYTIEEVEKMLEKYREVKN